MADNLERDVARHYGGGNLQERVRASLAAAGLDLENLSQRDLAPMDEFHIGGRAATEHLVARLGLEPHHHVLDVGCGIGGATRYIAAEIGCRVTGVDLTPEYIEIARDLSARTGLADRIAYMAASALSMPFPDESFDAAVTLHVAMNIRERERLYREVARVLKPGALFGLYDIMKGNEEGLRFPLPWAETAATSHLTTPDETASLLQGAGFTVEQTEDRRAFGVAFLRERLNAPPGGPNALGLHLVMGASARPKLENVIENIEADRIAPVLMIARRLNPR
jgi:ubiquinone/menaquinone biosynthesis C-methylase UbiE